MSDLNAQDMFQSAYEGLLELGVSQEEVSDLAHDAATGSED